MPVVLRLISGKNPDVVPSRGMGRFKTATSGHGVAMTHEEAVADFIRKDIHSHKNYPSPL
jgi:hypothetical protein